MRSVVIVMFFLFCSCGHEYTKDCSVSYDALNIHITCSKDIKGFCEPNSNCVARGAPIAFTIPIGGTSASMGQIDLDVKRTNSRNIYAKYRNADAKKARDWDIIFADGTSGILKVE